MTRTAVVICPGRGTYNKAELGYLGRHHADKTDFIAMVDAYRNERDQVTVSALDGAERYSVGAFSRGDNASPLIYACAYCDFLAIDRSKFDILAVTGNSMGWYIALACAGALSPAGGMDVVNTMGTLMQESLIGGQLVYPFVDADWREVPGRREEVFEHIRRINLEPNSSLYVSIELGGMLVLAGNEAGLAAAEAVLPRVDERFPLRLANHAAFHTPLQEPIAEKGRAALGPYLFKQPELAMVDGRGSIWYPQATDLTALREYTLGHQVTQTYDFTAAIHTSVREFAPDCLIVLGPGNTLGGAVAQSLISCGWDGLSGKTDFSERQRAEPLLISMGLDGQRPWAVS